MGLGQLDPLVEVIQCLLPVPLLTVSLPEIVVELGKGLLVPQVGGEGHRLVVEPDGPVEVPVLEFDDPEIGESTSDPKLVTQFLGQLETVFQ